jgi:hypothetical protein
MTQTAPCYAYKPVATQLAADIKQSRLDHHPPSMPILKLSINVLPARTTQANSLNSGHKSGQERCVIRRSTSWQDRPSAVSFIGIQSVPACLSVSVSISAKRFPPARTPAQRPSQSPADLRKRHSFFECFPYVGPEPVLVKRWRLRIHGAKGRVSLPRNCLVSHSSVLTRLSKNTKPMPCPRFRPTRKNAMRSRF